MRWGRVTYESIEAPTAMSLPRPLPPPGPDRSVPSLNARSSAAWSVSGLPCPEDRARSPNPNPWGHRSQTPVALKFP